MSKELAQSKSPEVPAKEKPGQTLNLAKQALRKAREMELSPEQKKNVIAMIDEAVKMEKVNMGKAYNLYNQLKDYLDAINLERAQELSYDDTKNTKKQLQLIDGELAKIGKVPFFGKGGLKKRKKYLEEQKELIEKSRQEKTVILTDLEAAVSATKIFSESEVWEQISSWSGVPEEKLFLVKKITDRKKRCLSLRLGVAGEPYRKMYYMLAGRYADQGSSLMSLIQEFKIHQRDGIDQTIEQTDGGIEYNEKLKSWQAIEFDEGEE